MKARLPGKGHRRVLALCLLAFLPTQVLAAPPKTARKAQVRGKSPARKGDYRTTFAAAVRLYKDFEYERALQQLTRAKALAQGVEQEVEVALYQGIVLAELDEREQSLAAFRTALYLKPDAKLPVKVSPKLERDFEDVRQSVLRDLGGPSTGSQEVASAPTESEQTPKPTEDRPVQPAPAKEPGLTARVEPPPPPPAYVPPANAGPAPRSNMLPLVLLGTGAVAGSAGGFFGLRSMSSVQSATRASYYDERSSHLKSAEEQAFVANILFGTAGAVALGALTAFIMSGGSESPSTPSTASASTGGVP